MIVDGGSGYTAPTVTIGDVFSTPGIVPASCSATVTAFGDQQHHARGGNPARFAQTNNCPIGGTGLAAGGSCTITVTFTPNRRAARSATVVIRDNAANSPQSVALSGTGI